MSGQRIPKPKRRQEFIPAMSDSELGFLTGQLGPADRKALREICEQGSVYMCDGRRYIVAPLSDDALDALAAFEAEGEDLEDFNEDWSPADGEASLGGHHANTWDVDLEEDRAEVEVF